eukprot:scaffold370645_cov41-Attheya_sp.AAC.1
MAPYVHAYCVSTPRYRLVTACKIPLVKNHALSLGILVGRIVELVYFRSERKMSQKAHEKAPQKERKDGGTHQGKWSIF